jgi:hypothetical protein
LIIGNSDYANANLKLTNPANDAAAMRFGFTDFPRPDILDGAHSRH